MPNPYCKSVLFCAGLCLLAPAFTRSAISAQSMPDMPHMQMPQSNPPAPDIQHMQQAPANQRDKEAAASEANSIHQQADQANQPAGPKSDAASMTIPTEELQEPEAIGFETGKDVPAPELLNDVVARTSMTLQDFLELADKTAPTILQAQRTIERSSQQARQASLPPNPFVGYSGDHIRGGSYHAGEEGAFFSQAFVLGRKLALRRNIYRAEGRANEFNLDIQRARLHDDVGGAFFDTLAAQESVVIHARLLKAALDAQLNAHELLRVGQADAADVLNAEITAEQAKLDFETAQRSFLSNFTQLALNAGKLSLEPHPLRGSLIQPPQLDVNTVVAGSVESSPYVKRAQAQVEMAEARLKDAKRERVPNLSIKAGEWYSGETLGATNVKAGWESFAEVGIDLPLWNRNQGNIQAAQASLEGARQNAERSKLWTKNQEVPLARSYQISRSTALRYESEMLPRGRRAWQLESMKYQQMAQPYSQVLAAQRMLYSLQLGYIEALNQEWRAALALENHALTGALEAPDDNGDASTMLNLPAGNQ